MPALIVFLIKVNIVLLLFAAAYFCFLRRLTFYQLNRFFLLFGILLSSVYPFINIEHWFSDAGIEKAPVLHYLPQVNVNEIISKPAIWENWNVWLGVFWIGFTYFLFRFILQLISLYQLHQKTKSGFLKGQKVRILNEEISPFSFGSFVYINPNIHNESELQSILEHENVHIKEWHTVDIIIAELASILYWFNPGIWLMKKAIKENLEFRADERMVKKGLNKKQYQYSLLAVGQLNSTLNLVNHFNLSDLKRRIIMMNTQRSAPFKKFVYLLLLPCISLLSLMFSFNTTQAVSVIEEQFPKTVEIAKSYIKELRLEQENKTKPVVELREKKQIIQPHAELVENKLIKEDANLLVEAPNQKRFIFIQNLKNAKNSDSVSSNLETNNLSKDFVYVREIDTSLKASPVSYNVRFKGVAADSVNFMSSAIVVRVDGKEVPNDRISKLFSDLNPNDIKSIHVIKASNNVQTVVGYASPKNPNAKEKPAIQKNEIRIETKKLN